MFRFELYFSLFLMLLLYVLGFFIVETSKRGVFFGIRIPEGYEGNEKLRSLKREYRRNYTLSSIAFWAVYAVFAKFFTEQFPLVMILSIFAFLIVLNSNYYITHKKVKELKKTDSWIVNRDDDENYILGSLYYNKYDPALMVKKRVGIGWDFNYARPTAKIIMGFIAVLLIFVLFMLSQLPKMTRERNIQVTSEEISISGAWGVTIHNNSIQKVSLESVLPEVVMRTNGASIGDKMFGRYKLKDHEKSTLFILDKNKPLIVIYLNNGEVVLINYEDTNSTERLYRKIVDTVNLD